MVYSIVTKYLHKHVYVAFIDFIKAFDPVNRSLLYKVLRKNNISGCLYKTITSIYASVKGAVKTYSGPSNSFDYPLELRQGCSLSPIQFALFINELQGFYLSNIVRGIQLFPVITEIF